MSVFFFHFELFSEFSGIKCSCIFYANRTLCTLFSQTDTFHTFSFHIHKKNFWYILPSTFKTSKISLPRFSSSMRAVCLPILLFCQRNDIWWRVQIIKPVIIFVQLALSFCQFSQLHSNIHLLALRKRTFS